MNVVPSGCDTSTYPGCGGTANAAKLSAEPAAIVIILFKNIAFRFCVLLQLYLVPNITHILICVSGFASGSDQAA